MDQQATLLLLVMSWSWQIERAARRPETAHLLPNEILQRLRKEMVTVPFFNVYLFLAYPTL
jgi:hypothetical protein